MRSVVVAAAVLAVFASIQACSDSSSPASAKTIEVTDGSSFTNLELGILDKIIVSDSDGDNEVEVQIAEKFKCEGTIELSPALAKVTFSSLNSAELGCTISTASSSDEKAAKADSSPPTLQFVAAGGFEVTAGFNPRVAANVIIADDPAQLLSVDDILADAVVDDGESPVIMSGEPEDESEPKQSSLVTSKARDCNQGVVNRLTGEWQGPQLDQPGDGEPIVVAFLSSCDVELANLEIEPPEWKDFLKPAGEEETTDSTDDESFTGQDGSNGLTLYGRFQGKAKVIGTVELILMNGGPGQPASVTGKSAFARGGKGGKPGGLKLQASQGIDVSQGELIIWPGHGGPGGDASAVSLDGASTCGSPEASGVATAIAGQGGDARRALAVRGVSGLDNVSFANYFGGDGGDAIANSGTGGSNCNGANRHGADAGLAQAIGGDGGDASFSASGFFGDEPDTDGGDGGNANANGGSGGSGGDQASCPTPPSGNGGAGGDARATGGSPGSGETNDGEAGDATSNPGAGGNCGDHPAVGGSNGIGTATKGDSSPGTVNNPVAPDNCPCPTSAPTAEPTASPTPTPTLTPSPTQSPTPTPTPSPTPTPTPSPTPTVTPEPAAAKCAGSYLCDSGCGFGGAILEFGPSLNHSGGDLDGVPSNQTLAFVEVASGDPGTEWESQSENIVLFGQSGHRVFMQFFLTLGTGFCSDMEFNGFEVEGSGECEASCSRFDPNAP